MSSRFAPIQNYQLSIQHLDWVSGATLLRFPQPRNALREETLSEGVSFRAAPLSVNFEL